jgi:hypothetical protein
MSDLEMWSGLVGSLLPLVVAKVIATDWSSEAKAGAAMASSILAAMGTVWFQGELNVENVTRSLLIVFTLAVVTYNNYWKPSGIAATLNREPGDIRTGRI